TLLEASAGLTRRTFGDQHVVVLTGDLSKDTRGDWVATAGAGVRVPRKPSDKLKIVWGLRVDASAARSNQNSYDAQRTQFLENYYDSNEVRLGGSVAAVFGRPKEK